MPSVYVPVEWTTRKLNEWSIAYRTARIDRRDGAPYRLPSPSRRKPHVIDGYQTGWSESG